MRISSLALSAVLIAGLPAGALLAQDQNQTPQAQTPDAGMGQHHAPNPQREAKRMTKKLNLSSDQEQKLEPILSDRDQQMESARADTSMSPQDKHSKMKSIREDADSKIEAVLNDQQKQQYEQMKQNHHEKKQNAGAAS